MSDRLGEADEPRHGDSPAAPESWHATGLDEAFKRLKASPKGLSDEEARARLASYGPNALPRSAPASFFVTFLRQFKTPSCTFCLSLPSSP